MLIPTDADHSRVTFSYDYRIGSRGSDIVIGHDLVDDRLELVEDPVVSNDLAQRTQAQLERRAVRVYFDANHPYTTAFMLNPLSAERVVRPEQGALLVMFGIACSILAQLTRLRR